MRCFWTHRQDSSCIFEVTVCWFWVPGSPDGQQGSRAWEGREGPAAQLDGQDHTTAPQQHSAQPHDLLYSSLATNAEEKEGRAIIEQFICKCLKYQIKASPLAFIRKKKLDSLVSVCVCWVFFFLSWQDKAHCGGTSWASWFSSCILVASRHRLGPGFPLPR